MMYLKLEFVCMRMKFYEILETLCEIHVAHIGIINGSETNE